MVDLTIFVREVALPKLDTGGSRVVMGEVILPKLGTVVVRVVVFAFFAMKIIQSKSNADCSRGTGIDNFLQGKQFCQNQTLMVAAVVEGACWCARKCCNATGLRRGLDEPRLVARLQDV